MLRVTSLVAARSLCLALALAACGTSIPRRDPTGATFPDVVGTSLDGSEVRLPRDLEGAPAILLAGYEMESQFDLDRWLLGLLQAGTPITLFELPTIPGLVPGLVAGSIDDGMRSGIPSEDWATVVTLYGDDASRVTELTGTEKDRNGRIFLIDQEGRIAWFHDRGYSAGRLAELDARARELIDPVSAEDAAMKTEPSYVFDFSDPEAVAAWSAIDDRVMGGVSSSGLVALADGTAAFRGDLSLESGGGFASVRADVPELDLAGHEGVAIHARGDGRVYKLRLRNDTAFDGVSYQVAFATRAGEWATVRLPFAAFVPTRRGRLDADAPPLDPRRVVSFGLLVSDEQAGRFELEVAWIDAF